MTLLHIDASILGDRSVTRDLSAAIVRQLAKDHTVIYRDVVADDLPHFSAATAPSAHPISKAAPAHTAEQQSARATSDTILGEFLSADVIVIGVPMYNFAPPSQLKTWLDRIVVPETTFRRTASGLEGLVPGKRVVLAIARGAVFEAGTPFASYEHAEALLRTVFGFLGITDIETVITEGLSAGDEARTHAVAQAKTRIAGLAG